MVYLKICKVDIERPMGNILNVCFLENRTEDIERPMGNILMLDMSTEIEIEWYS